jgi:predicted nucleic acid-binding protein
MLDTNVFDAAAKNPEIKSAITGRAVYYSTHVQADELGRTGDHALRARLLSQYGAVGPEELPTQTSLWDETPWDKGAWSAGDGLYEKLLISIVAADLESKKRSRQPLNSSRDARIGETAIRGNLTLVTNDRGLLAAVRENGGAAITLTEFISIIAT